MKVDTIETHNYKGIPAMSSPEVHAYLNELGRGWTGAGCALEAGCWLGATSAALLDGLVEAGYDRPFWAFDRWKANESEIHKAGEQDVELIMGQQLLPLYLINTLSIYQDINATVGKIPHVFEAFSGEHIELCMFDAPKCNPIFLKSIRFVEPFFIPGVTVLGLLDFYSYRKHRDIHHDPDWVRFLAPVKFMETYSEHFTLLREFPGKGSCAFFRYEKEISWE